MLENVLRDSSLTWQIETFSSSSLLAPYPLPLFTSFRQTNSNMPPNFTSSSFDPLVKRAASLEMQNTT